MVEHIMSIIICQSPLDSSSHPQFEVGPTSPHSPFLNPTDTFAVQWKVHHPHQHATLTDAMEEPCGNTDVEACQCWMYHLKFKSS